MQQKSIALIAVAVLFAAASALAEPCNHNAGKVCVPEPAKKKVEKVSYGCKEVDFCVPRILGLFHVCSPCDDCQPCKTCGKVYTKRVLIKKVQTTECDAVKLVPKDLCPPCPPGQ